MRRTQAKHCALVFADDEFHIADQRCHVCGNLLRDDALPHGEGQLFVTGAGPNGAIELAYCSVGCIRTGGALAQLTQHAERRRA